MENESTKTRGVFSAENSDWLLRWYVEQANLTGEEFLGVTLQVGGLIISGTIAPAQDYYTATSLNFLPAEKEAPEGTWAWQLRNLSNRSKEVAANPKNAPAPTYVHLRDAQIHLNGQRALPSGEGVWWRGKLSSVDGFWIGRLAVQIGDK